MVRNRLLKRFGTAILVCVATGFSAWLLTSCQMPELTRVSGQDGQFPTPQTCAHCHVEIYDEWSRSPHAAAFVSNSFRRATDDHHFLECLSCHAPEPTLTSGQPMTRMTQLDLGVVCVTCHLDHGAMVGPHAPTGIVKPHPIKVDATLFENGTLCGRCHQSTLSQWQSARTENKLDCRECHMPEVHRTMTQATSLISKPLVAAESAGLEHRHLFNLTPTDPSIKAYDLRVEVLAGNATVTLVNLLPHNLPTGDFGVRIVKVKVWARDAVGEESRLGEFEITGNVGGSIPPGGSRRWPIVVPPDARRLKLELSHEGPDPAGGVVLLNQEVDLP